jgi:glycosyltransferase involved in cell wall biosynthesis
MNIVFTHDTCFDYDPNSDTYYHEILHYDFWGRYLEAFDQVHVCVRHRIVNGADIRGKKPCGGPGIRILPIPNLGNPIHSAINRRKAQHLLEQAIREADGLICRLPSEIGHLAAGIANRLGKPWIVELVNHAYDMYWNHGSVMGKVYAPISTWRTQRMVREASHALYVTQTFLQDIYPSSNRSLGCSDVDIDTAEEQVLQRRLDRIAGQPNPIRIGIIGSLAQKAKGIDTAMRALRIVRPRIPPFEFHILGGGNQAPWKQVAKENGLDDVVQFSGTLPAGAEVWGWLDQIDLYLQPSNSEGLPRALVEAMGRGLPALGSTAGGIPELLPRECLIEPRDHQGLSHFIEQAVSDPQWMVVQAVRNFNKAKQYTKPVLDQQRKLFWNDYIQHVQQVR